VLSVYFFAGISDNDVSASAPGLTKVGNGKYNMSPGGGKKLLLVSQVKCLMVKLQLIKKYTEKGIPVQQEQLEVKQVV
jgi:hypothetical protein